MRGAAFMLSLCLCSLILSCGDGQSDPPLELSSPDTSQSTGTAPTRVDWTLVPYRSGERWGFANLDLDLVISPQYAEVSPFAFGLAQVRIRQRWGLINATGQIVQPLQYDWIYGPRKGHYLVMHHDTITMLDLAGVPLLSDAQAGDIYSFDSLHADVVDSMEQSFKQKYAPYEALPSDVWNGGYMRFGPHFIDQHDDTVLYCQYYQLIDRFKHGYAFVHIDGNKPLQNSTGYVDTTGRKFWDEAIPLSPPITAFDGEDFDCDDIGNKLEEWAEDHWPAEVSIYFDSISLQIDEIEFYDFDNFYRYSFCQGEVNFFQRDWYTEGAPMVHSANFERFLRGDTCYYGTNLHLSYSTDDLDDTSTDSLALSRWQLQLEPDYAATGKELYARGQRLIQGDTSQVHLMIEALWHQGIPSLSDY